MENYLFHKMPSHSVLSRSHFTGDYQDLLNSYPHCLYHCFHLNLLIDLLFLWALQIYFYVLNGVSYFSFPSSFSSLVFLPKTFFCRIRKTCWEISLLRWMASYRSSFSLSDLLQSFCSLALSLLGDLLSRLHEVLIKLFLGQLQSFSLGIGLDYQNEQKSHLQHHWHELQLHNKSIIVLLALEELSYYK